MPMAPITVRLCKQAEPAKDVIYSMEKLSACPLCSNNKICVVDDISKLAECLECGYVFDNPRPTPQEISEYYSRASQYDNWLAVRPERELLWRRRLNKLLMHDVRGDLLDIGTGIGQFLAVARHNFSTLTGTEISASAAQIARDLYGLDVINDALEHIDFGESRFDIVTLFHVLEHVHDPAAVVKKCHDLLRDNGILLIAVPNELQSFRQKARSYLCRLGLLKSTFHGKFGIAPIVLDGSLAEIHLSHFTPSVIDSLVRRYGFAVLENSLDPYFVAKGWVNVFQLMYYRLMDLILRLTRHNFYDTIWLVAKKQTASRAEGN